MTTFLALLMSLPAGNSTVRMRVWRALKSTGCGVLRDGVYLLPPDAPQAGVLTGLESEVKAAGGFAMTVELRFKTGAQLDHARTLFDRSREYGALVAGMSRAKASLPRLGRRKAETLVRRLRRAFDELAGIDFHPGQAKLQARDALSALESDLSRLFAGGEPHVSRKRVRLLSAASYRDRTWATREDPWVDRLACAWLIKRFIDTRASFVWIARAQDRPKRAVGFDFDGAEFTHAESRVTFEVLLRSFGLERDPALVAIGRAVHFLDTGGIPVADAHGLEAMIRGVKAKTGNDDEAAREGMKVFDLLYAGYVRRGDEAAL